MGSRGIRDRVCIVGMGCIPFGEHWDLSTEDMLLDAATATLGVGRDDARRHRRLLARHGRLGHLRPHAVAGAAHRRQARHPAGEHVRHRLRGAPQRQLRRGVGGLRRGHGHRRGEAEGLRLLRAHPDEHPQRRDRLDHGRHHPAGQLQPPGPGLRQAVRRRRRRAEGRAHPHRLEEPPERVQEPAGPVPQGGGQGDDLRLPAGGREPRRLRLLRAWPTARRRPSWCGPRTPTATPTSRCT